MHISRNASDKSALDFKGSPAELADIIDELEATESGIVSFGGLQVVSVVNRNAKHDGNPAFGFEIGDAFGSRTVGRVILMDTDQQLEFQPEWTVYYDDVSTAEENFTILSHRKEWPKVSTVTLDFAFSEDSEDLDEACAIIASRYGVSIKVVNPRGPAGGWPEIEVTGLTVNVEKLLREGWNLDAEEVIGHLG